MSEAVYFFNDQQQLTATAFEETINVCLQEMEITEDKSELVKDVLTVEVQYDKAIANSSYMAVKDWDKTDEYVLYKIGTQSDPDDTLSFAGTNFGPHELDGFVVKDYRPENKTMEEVAKKILEGTGWTVKYVENGIKRVNGTFYYTTVKDSLKTLQELGCEVIFRCKLDGDGVSEKWIEIYKQIGQTSDQRFVHGEDGITVVEEIDKGQIYTSLIGRGRGEEVGDGYGRRLEFQDVVWTKSSGKPLDKPKGQIFLEDPAMTAKYGIPSNGKMLKREKVVIFEDIEDPAELLQATYDHLKEVSRVLTQYRTDQLGGDSLGNRVTVHRYDRNYHYEARVFKLTIDRLTGLCTSDLGDNLSKNIAKTVASTQNNVVRLSNEKLGFKDTTEVSKYQSDIIRGAGKKGGSVMMMSPSDLGISDDREPFQIVWMNGKDIASSDNFLVANSQGIGFIDGDFNLDKFETAWTIDGSFNANYIRAGKIMADIFETSFNGVGDTLKLKEGMLQIWNKSNLIMELTKEGMEFWDASDKIGSIGTIGRPSVGGAAAENKESKRAIIVGLEDDGEFIQISTGEDTGPNDKYGILMFPTGEMLTKSGKGSKSWIHAGDLDIVGNLSVNGQQVTGGGSGGGGWNGQYPPEVTSQADKFAWQLWVTLLSLGYSKAAIAGILGNVQGEVGASMNPDTEQVGGPAYGAVQWDGSAYPLVGAPTWNGREYVQRLIAEAKIKEDYKTMVAQGKLIEWSNHNGQWIGAVTPTTVSGFKSVSDPKVAARAFELNFERPAAAHPERQGWAQEWYDKFKNLTVSTSGFIAPISNPISVTSEFGWRKSPFPPFNDEFHNGIDLVNGNPNTPIYASAPGTVEVVGNYPEWYGLYVVIKHANGKYTGYAHNSAIRVAVGQQVAQGQQIATMGTTGPSTAEHCHFQIMDSAWPVSTSGYENPRPYIFGN